MGSTNCKICKVELNQPGKPETRDCGGDCLKCMALVGGDPDCIVAMKKVCCNGNCNQGRNCPYR